MRILIVDDNIDTCSLLAEYFVLTGHEAVAVSTAYEALERTSADHFDAMILDIMLPDLDGYALACRVRRLLAFTPRIRIIAVSATAFDSAHPFAQEAGFDAYLVKPTNLDVIDAALQRDGAS